MNNLETIMSKYNDNIDLKPIKMKKMDAIESIHIEHKNLSNMTLEQINAQTENVLADAFNFDSDDEQLMFEEEDQIEAKTEKQITEETKEEEQVKKEDKTIETNT